jgi:hypothetical protein
MCLRLVALSSERPVWSPGFDNSLKGKVQAVLGHFLAISFGVVAIPSHIAEILTISTTTKMTPKSSMLFYHARFLATDTKDPTARLRSAFPGILQGLRLAFWDRLESDGETGPHVRPLSLNNGFLNKFRPRTSAGRPQPSLRKGGPGAEVSRVGRCLK